MDFEKLISDFHHLLLCKKAKFTEKWRDYVIHAWTLLLKMSVLGIQNFRGKFEIAAVFCL